MSFLAFCCLWIRRGGSIGLLCTGFDVSGGGDGGRGEERCREMRREGKGRGGWRYVLTANGKGRSRHSSPSHQGLPITQTTLLTSPIEIEEEKPARNSPYPSSPPPPPHNTSQPRSSHLYPPYSPHTHNNSSQPPCPYQPPTHADSYSPARRSRAPVRLWRRPPF